MLRLFISRTYTYPLAAQYKFAIIPLGIQSLPEVIKNTLTKE